MAEHNQTELFQILMNQLTETNEGVLLDLDRAGHSLLHVAAQNGSPEMLEILLNGPHAARLRELVNAQTIRDQETALHLASRYGHSRCVQLLLQTNGAKSSLRDAKGSNALHLALQQTFNIEKLVGVFTDCSLDSEETFQSLDEMTGRNCLHTAIIKNFRTVSLALLKGKRVQLNIATREGGWSPLHLAVMTEEIEIIKALLESGSMLDMVDNDGQTPLLQACLGGNLAIVRLLLNAGANPAHQNKQAHSPLHYLAAFCRDQQLLVDLIDRGADVSAKSLKLNTPLHFAAMNGNEIATQVLLVHGASASAINEDKRSVVYLAKKWRHRSVEELVKPPEEMADQHGGPSAGGDGKTGRRPPSSGLPSRSFVAQQVHGILHSRSTTPLTSRSEDSDTDSHYNFEDEEILPPSTPWPVEISGEAGNSSSNNNSRLTASPQSRSQSFSELRDKFMALALTPQRTILQPVPLSQEKKHHLDTMIASTTTLQELPSPSSMQMTRFTRKFLADPVKIPWEMTVPVPLSLSAGATAAESGDSSGCDSLQRKLKPCIRTNIGLFRDHLAHAQQLSWPQHAHHKAFRKSSLKYQAPPPHVSR